MTEEKKEDLTKEELQMLIQICNSISVPVNQASLILKTIDKLTKILQKK